ncbi:MAG TPA: hypothetical protein PKY59_20475 [Pyrinomonadaceae bacterium]|nr:hypothetical protein [Pyrinomonadaceae bacterium]
MNDRERRLYEMFLRVLTFLQANAADFDNIPAVAAVVTVLLAETPVLGNLGEVKVTDTSTAKDKTIFRGDNRDAVRDAMQDISDMWKPMAKNYQGASNRFAMPHGSDQLLIDTARSFVVEATPLRDDFVARGMPANFIADLTAKIDAFEDSISESSTARIERVGTNASFKPSLDACREAVADVDPIVKMVYRANAQKRAEWLVASHVERR